MWLNRRYAKGTDNQQHTRYNHHCALMTANQLEHHSATQGSYDLRQTDGTVEQSQIGTHVSVAL